MRFCCEFYPQAFKRSFMKEAKTEEEREKAKTMQPGDRVFVSKTISTAQLLQSG